MRIVLLAGLCLFVNCGGLLFAQNKTLGVGAATPNPNAALHVESPTGNQGFIMPRLTTVQREAMVSLLTTGDKGLMLYDTDLGAIFIWDGVAWKSSAQFTNDNPASTADGINVVTKGLGSAGRFRTDNTKSKMPTVWAETNSDSALSAPIYGLNTGKGDVAASFRINNAANTFPALFAESNGTGRTATFRKTGTTGGQPAVFVESLGGHGIWADHNATNGFAGIIQTINTANPNAALLAESIGTGPSIFVLKSVDAVAGDALRAENNIGSGSAASFAITNAANGFPVISTTTNGTGPAIRAENSGAANGFAATFDVTNPANQYPAVQVSSAGNGSGVRVMQPKGMGAGVDVFMQNPSSPASGVAVDQGGNGYGGSFIISNPSNSSHAVQAITKGMGAALEASTATGYTALYARHDGATNGNAGLIEITNSANTYPALQVNTAGTGFAINARHTGTTGDAIYAEHAGAGSGSAGNFRISYPENSASAVFAATNSANGTAMGASNDADGIAFAIWRGGVKVTTMDVTTSVIPARASAYRLTSGGPSFSLGFPPIDGEVFMIYNETGLTITFTASGINHSLLTGEGKTFIVFGGGAVRGF